jgi:hypothetical protein
MRAKKAQNKHDAKVKNIARGYRAQGYRVAADVPGYPQPRSFGRRRPDVVAQKGRDKVIVEVETPRSMATDVAQRQALRRSAKKKNMRFRTVKTR